MNRLSRDRALWLMIAGLLLVYLPLLLNVDAVPFYREASHSDLLISHLPNAKFIRASLSEWGQIPLWNPTIYSGTPFAADPLSGMMYLPAWLTVVLPQPSTFNLLLLIHFFWAAAGCYLLARKSDLIPAAAVISGIAFAATPKLISHLGLGHVSLLYAVSWTPWLLVCVDSTVDMISDAPARMAIVSGAVLGLIFLADPRWSIPSLLLATGYGLYLWFRLPIGRRGSPLQIARTFLSIMAISFGLAALLGIPLWEYVRLSTRASLVPELNNYLALDWSHILGLIHPILAQPEQVTYVGASVLFLALIGLVSGGRGGGFWGLVFVISLMLSLGGTTPLYPLLTRILPGAGLLRVPPRMLFLCALSSAMLAGSGAAWILKQTWDQRKLKHVRLAGAGFVMLVLVTNIALAFLKIGSTSNQLLASLSTLAVGTLLELRIRQKLSMGRAGFLSMAIVLIELFWIGRSMIRLEVYPALGVEQDAAVDGLTAGSFGVNRIFSPSYAIPQLAAVEAKLELADGVNPLQLSAYYEYLQQATGFDSQGYTVSIPPFPGGDPKQAWPLELDLELLAKLNIRYLVSDFPVQAEGILFVDKSNNLYLYGMDMTRPRAWIDEERQENWTTAEILLWTPNLIRVQASGPGVLVLSEIAYPGWYATIDGMRVEIVKSGDLFRSVNLPDGDHLVEFKFQPASVFLGMISFSMTFLAAVLLWRRR